ncbi:MAG TPA: lysine-sensitive aspartokinase 3 [Gemmatimonadaceae bacterium]|nr:lysine-sensitive aspartokinase 3 [Gemmatimonadaceae bacterium]
MIVLKFGGTSVADIAAIDRAVSIVRSRLSRAPVVVVSALAGTTNALLKAAHDAARGDRAAAREALAALRDRHLAVMELLVRRDPMADEAGWKVERMCDALMGLVEALAILGHVTPRSLDAVAAHGELLSTTVVTAAMRADGIRAEAVDARKVIVSDDRFTRAMPLPDAIADAAGDVLRPLVETGRVPVLGGYIGSTADGVTTTLGRGGSDLSAALIGAALDAEAIEIWTDVDGMLTVDPKIDPCARTIDHIRFDEAAELAAFGARVLHPATIAPAMRRGIPVRVLNSLRPEANGTRITATAPVLPVRAIAGRDDVTVIKVRSSAMLMAHGFLRALFDVFERHGTSVDVVATSEVSVSVTVDALAPVESIAADLAHLGEVMVERERAVIAVVGAGLGGDSAIMARALEALAGVRVHMISVSASEINLTLVVDAEHLRLAMSALHATFFGGLPPGAAAAA